MALPVKASRPVVLAPLWKTTAWPRSASSRPTMAPPAPVPTTSA
jgi:hypothetical protein